MRTSRTAVPRVSGVVVAGRRRRVRRSRRAGRRRRSPCGARRCRAGRGRCGRRRSSPLTPEVPQQRAARTTSRNPGGPGRGRAREDGRSWIGSGGGSSASRRRVRGCAGSARGAPGQERGGGRTSACRGVMAGSVAGRRRPAAAFLYSGRQTPRAASSCEPPQGRKAARISGLWRVCGGSFCRPGRTAAARMAGRMAREPGALPQVPPGDLRRGRRAGARHRAAGQAP